MLRTILTFFAYAIFFFTTISSDNIHFINNSFADSPSASISLNPVQKTAQGSQPQYVFDVVIHEPEEMDKLLTRIEHLSSTLTTNKNDPRLALVLHGPEIAFFTKNNYSKYMKLVDRAAGLDKKGIIDVKVCDTMIQALDIDGSDLPEFVEHVPFGPAEVDRLIEQGFIKM
ncbi:MAG: DsrE family protein [Gammaproteobacteria bacterium]|nr:DsrE family protein [Gammaproteobacteria bacterium]